MQINLIQSPRSPRLLPLDEVQRIMEKLIKHNRAEEAAIKRIRDLEMQINGIRVSYNVSICFNFSHFRIFYVKAYII